MSSFYWNPPVISPNENEEDTGTRCSSPLVYGEGNPIYGMEIFVTDREGKDMGIIRQIIGNFGGYANPVYYDDTNVIMLGGDTLQKLQQGIKDEVIQRIENEYNHSSSRMFNIQFTSETDFIDWVNKRLEKFPDESTIELLKAYRKQIE